MLPSALDTRQSQIGTDPVSAGNSDVLRGLAIEMYARGLSVHDVEDALRDATGQPLLSRNAVSELSETLWEDDEAFCERDLSSSEVGYVSIYAVYEGLR